MNLGNLSLAEGPNDDDFDVEVAPLADISENFEDAPQAVR